MEELTRKLKAQENLEDFYAQEALDEQFVSPVEEELEMIIEESVPVVPKKTEKPKRERRKGKQFVNPMLTQI